MSGTGQDALIRIVAATASDGDVGVAPAIVAETVRDALVAMRVAVAILQIGGDRYGIPALTDAAGPAAAREGAWRLGVGVLGRVLRDGRDLRVAHVAREIPAAEAARDPFLVGAPIGALFVVPLRGADRTYGALAVGTDRHRPLDDAQIDLVQTAARALTGALERARLQRLTDFPELNPAAIVEMDPTGAISYVNRAGRTLFEPLGYASPMLADLPAQARTLPPDGSRHIREHFIDGHWYQQLLHLVPATGFIRSFVIDITDRKEIEARLQRQNAYLAALQETTLDLLSELDLGQMLEGMVSRAGRVLETPHGFVCVAEPG